MFQFTKKTTHTNNVEEQELQELTDEQLTQVAGGGLLSSVTNGGLLSSVTNGGLLGTVTGTTSSLLGSTPVQVNAGTGVNAQVGGVNVTAGALLGANN